MSNYLHSWRPTDGSRAVLLCLPQAAAGAGTFRAWAQRFEDVDVLAVQLPGREQRFADPPAANVDEVVSAVTAELAALPTGRPLVVFGDSFGGLLGFEVALRCAADALVVTACRAPSHWSGSGRGITPADLEALLAGSAATADLDEDSRSLVAEVLRADAVLSSTYRVAPDARLPCPVHAWAGRHDRTVSADQLDDWRTVAGGEFHRRDFDSDHLLLARCPEEVVAAVREVLATARAAEVLP